MTRHSLAALAVLLIAGAQARTQQLSKGPILKAQGPRTIAFSPDGKLLASGGAVSRRGELKLWDIATGAEIAAVEMDRIENIAFSPNGKLLATTNGFVSEESIQLWDVPSLKRTATFSFRESLAALRFSADGKTLGATAWSTAAVWDVGTGKEVASTQRPHYSVRQTFNHDLSMLAAADYQEIDLINVATGKTMITLSEHRGEVGFMAFSADGKTLLAESTRHRQNSHKWFGDLKLWDVSKGKERASFEDHIGLVRQAALSPDGQLVAALDTPELNDDPVLKLIDVASGRQTIIKCPDRHVFINLTFAGNKLFVVGTPDDKDLQIWEVTLPKSKGR